MDNNYIDYEEESIRNMNIVLHMCNLELDAKGQIPCPICTADKPNSRYIHVYNGVFRCPRCTASGNALHLLGLWKYGFTKEYINENPEVKKKLYKEIKGQKTDLVGVEFTRPEIKRVDVPLHTLEERNKTYNALINRLGITDAHYNNLVKRGLRESDIYENRYASVPNMGFTKIPTELRKEACDLLGVPGFYKKGETWTMAKTKSGFFIPARDVPVKSKKGLIQGMQIRFDTVSENETRYKWWSTKDMESGSAAETFAHFVGSPEITVLLTEGPLKADIIHRFTGLPVIAIPGVNCLNNLKPMLEKLWKIGVRKIKTAFDMDYKKNSNVQDAYVKLILCLQEYGFEVERLVWDENFKGFDDFLLSVFLERGGKLGTMK